MNHCRRSDVRTAHVAAMAAATLLAGCGAEPPVGSPSTSTAVASSAPVKADVAPPPPKPAAVAPNKPAAPRRVETAWEPPFPNRTEMFEPPRFARRATNTNGDNSPESVVLMGFADLGTPKAVLAINGVVTPLAENAEDSGVQVISIAPPRVVLQRGRSRWTASIE